jgi:hypothetical protein
MTTAGSFPWNVIFGPARSSPQGELISAYPSIGDLLISSSEQPHDPLRSRPVVFTYEENHDYFVVADS